jgi:hypothetical protein
MRRAPNREQHSSYPALRRVVDCFGNERDDAIVAIEGTLVVAKARAERSAEYNLRLLSQWAGNDRWGRDGMADDAHARGKHNSHRARSYSALGEDKMDRQGKLH